MLKSFLVTAAIFGAALGQVRTAPQGEAEGAIRDAPHAGLEIHNVHTSYRTTDTLELDVLLINTGPGPLYVGQHMPWGTGLWLNIRNEDPKKGPQDRAMHHVPPAPPARDDPSIFLRLEADAFIGTRTRTPLTEAKLGPGKYKVQAHYLSPFLRDWFSPRIQAMPVLWMDRTVLDSNDASFEVRR